MIAWVFFRADTFEGARSILSSMSGLNGIVLPQGLHAYLKAFDAILIDYKISFGGTFINGLVTSWADGINIIMILFLIVWFLPNVQQLVFNYQTIKNNNSLELVEQDNNYWIIKKPVYAVLLGMTAAISVLSMNKISEFLYFNF